MASREISQKRILLTGASSGLGVELATQLALQNAKLILTARREEPLNLLAEKINHSGGSASVILADITSENDRQQIVKFAQSNLGGIDILINNAGVGAMGNFEEASAERLRKVFEVNFFAATEMIRVCLPLLRAGNQPAIVNISSVLGHRAVPQKSEYCASKFAIHGFSDSLRAELRNQVDVILISPSTIDTEFFNNALDDPTGRDWKSKGAMSPEYVASKIVRAIRSASQEVILPFSGKLLVWLDRICPPLANWLVAKYG